MLKAILIEDEPLARERVLRYIAKLPAVRIIQTFENALDAIAFLEENPVELIFLDIHLASVSGIEFLERTKFRGEVIITTAYPDYALKGFELHVSDYLMKPFSFERFEESVKRVLQRSKNFPQDPCSYIFVKTEYRLEKIDLDEILYIEGMRDYRRIHTSSKRIMTLQTFKDFEKQLSGSFICRVHKSYMVSMPKIESIERDRIRVGGELIPISETYRAAFMALVKK